MFQSIFQDVQKPEPGRVLWDWPLPFWLLISYLIAFGGLGLLPVTTARDVDLTDPDAFSWFAAGTIAGVVMLWVVVRNIWSAIIDEREEARTDKSKKPAADALSVRGLLRLTESETRPLWIVTLMGFGVMIAVDTFSLILGRGGVFPIGLDRIEQDMVDAWLVGALLFAVVRPLIEQIIFQGILYPVLAKRLDDNFLAILIAAAFYALFYFLQVAGSGGWQVVYWGILFPFALGICTGIARAATKSTWGAIGIHSLIGLFIMLSAAIAV